MSTCYFEVWDGAGSADDFLAIAKSLMPKSVVDRITIYSQDEQRSQWGHYYLCSSAMDGKLQVKYAPMCW